MTLGDSLPYEPGYFVHFLAPRGRIGLGYITGIFGEEYKVVHIGTRASKVSSEYISPTSRTRKSHALRSALSPLLTTIKCRSKLRVTFKLGTKFTDQNLAVEKFKLIFYHISFYPILT